MKKNKIFICFAFLGCWTFVAETYADIVIPDNTSGLTTGSNSTNNFDNIVIGDGALDLSLIHI